MEMEGFNIVPEEKHAQWKEGAEQAANMMVMQPYPGYEGQYFTMPARNVLPKPFQKPHPPMWLACSRRDSILRAARYGMGALIFGFVEPDQAKQWVKEYYDVIKSEECVPLGHTVNPNLAAVSGFSIHQDEAEAERRGLPGFRYFGYSLAHFTNFGEHTPSVTGVAAQFDEVYDSLPDNAGRGGIGTPAQVEQHLRGYEDIGLDQIIFVQQVGRNQLEHICESLELFGKSLLPAFKEREEKRHKAKMAELAPYIEAALARKVRMPDLPRDQIPSVKAAGKRRIESGEVDPSGGAFVDKTRGGSIPIPHADPRSTKQV